jgi:hypothetical protein
MSTKILQKGYTHYFFYLTRKAGKEYTALSIVTLASEHPSEPDRRQ